MNAWETATGLLIFVASLLLFWHYYYITAQCNSVAGQVVTAITSIFGGNAAQQCYNSGVIEVGSVIGAIIGLVVIYESTRKPAHKVIKK